MAKLSYSLRKNGAGIEQTVIVRHFHKTKDTEFSRTTGIKVHPQYFDLDTGKVSNKLPMAPEWNTAIQRVATDIETAFRNLVGKGIHASKAAMTQEYDRILTERETAIRVTPKINRFFENHIEELKQQLAELQQQVLDKKKEIEAEELKMGIYENKLLSKYIMDYATAISDTKAANTIRLYQVVSRTVTAYDAAWRIDDVTSDTLAAFESWMITQGKRNLTITDTITKIKTVVYYYSKKLNMNVEDVRSHKPQVEKKRNPNVVFLTQDELQDLIDLPISKTVENKVRDRFVLMCLVGMRYSDTNITSENIFNDELLFTTEKTDTDITIPISAEVREILERYENNIVSYPSQHFNKIIKDICSRIPSLQRKIQVKTYQGKNKPVKTTTEKYNMISAHVGRRTFINLALIQGVSPVAIAGIVGHEGTDLIMTKYGSKEAGKDGIKNLMKKKLE